MGRNKFFKIVGCFVPSSNAQFTCFLRSTFFFHCHSFEADFNNIIVRIKFHHFSQSQMGLVRRSAQVRSIFLAARKPDKYAACTVAEFLLLVASPAKKTRLSIGSPMV